MNLRSFADELSSLPAGRRVLVKIADGAAVARLAGLGGAVGLGGLGYQHLKHMVTKDPYDQAFDSPKDAVVKGIAGGLSVAGVVHLLSKLKK